MEKPVQQGGRRPVRGGLILLRVCLLAFSFLAFLALFSAAWYASVYGNVGFEAVLYSVLAGVAGVQQGLVVGWLLKGLLPAVIATALFGVLLLFTPRRLRERLHVKEKILRLISAGLSVVLLLTAAYQANLLTWLRNKMIRTDFYQQQYIDPGSVKITFPEKKRNLVYLYLESMENTFLSTEQGGGLDVCTIPELYGLAQQNINFSDNTGVGGGQALFGATWTIGAMVAQGAGLPLRTSLKIDRDLYGDYYAHFLPGAVCLTDVLHQNGYRQVFVCGSDSNYGGRNQFYTQHGVDQIYDYNSAIKEGFIPSDYRVWWGMEDQKTYAYAKKKLSELAGQGEPFSFTLLSADTHHVDGYICDLCSNQFKEQYQNVCACASRQAAEFVAWLQQQPFYENTTVIVTGDHCTMDYAYIQRCMKEDYQRSIYNCFINAPQADTHTKNRKFCTMDMFPTTLAALGCTIDGERLGFGTNLFCGNPTLSEQFGNEYLDQELSRGSSYYDKKFHYNR